MIGFLLSGCLGPFASDPGALHLRVYNETPDEVDLQIDLMQDGQRFNASMTLPGHTREGLPPSGDIKADLDAGRYKVRVLVDAHPCTPPEEPTDWDGTVGSINHIVGAIWAVNVMPDLSCKISKIATA